MNSLTKLLSFLFPIPVYTKGTLYNSNLKVSYSSGKYLLNCGNANYSFGNLHTAFQIAFKRSELIKKPISNVLILGFGAGSIAHILQKELKLKCVIQGVEIDKELLELAKHYFDFDKISDCKVAAEDAQLFLENSTNTYDLIVVDLFQELEVPSKFQELYFLELIKNKLSTNGHFYYNFVVNNESQLQKFKALRSKVNAIFPAAKEMQLPLGNRMLIF
jgi:spermidine synthase